MRRKGGAAPLVGRCEEEMGEVIDKGREVE